MLVRNFENGRKYFAVTYAVLQMQDLSQFTRFFVANFAVSTYFCCLYIFFFFCV